MENIQVSLRLRPLSEKEITLKEKSAWEVHDKNTVVVMTDNISNPLSRNILQNALSLNKQLNFTYDQCFNETMTNKQVYENSV